MEVKSLVPLSYIWQINAIIGDQTPRRVSAEPVCFGLPSCLYHPFALPWRGKRFHGHGKILKSANRVLLGALAIPNVSGQAVIILLQIRLDDYLKQGLLEDSDSVTHCVIFLINPCFH